MDTEKCDEHEPKYLENCWSKVHHSNVLHRPEVSKTKISLNYNFGMEKSGEADQKERG